MVSLLMHEDVREILVSLYKSLRGGVRVGVTNKRIRVLSRVPVNLRLITIILDLTCSYKTRSNHYIYFYDKDNKWLQLANRTTQEQFVRRAYRELRSELKYQSSGYVRLNKRFIVNKDRLMKMD
jgi:hypothetical protein